MLQNIFIQNYKSIASCQLDFGKINLLTGANSTGKSSVIQSLLLFADNVKSEQTVTPLISKHFNTYAFTEVSNYIQNAKTYSVGTNVNGKNCELNFIPADDAKIKTNVAQKGFLSEDLYELLTKELLYLPAIREGNLSITRINTNSMLNPLGIYGEYVIDFYYTHKYDILPIQTSLDIQIAKNLDGLVNYWLQKLTGYSMEVTLSGSEYHLQYISNGRRIASYHVGTGVSYITTVLIVCLASLQNGLVIIENPEIHLHPSAQADLLDFFAEIANAGAQIIIESHSDHFFNGIRRLLHHRKINIDDVRLYHFSKQSFGNSNVIRVELSQEGGIKKYIPGMFEQFDNDLDQILS